MLPETALLLARLRLAVRRRPGILAEAPWYLREGERVRAAARKAGVDELRALNAAAVLSPAVRWEDLVRRLPAFLLAFRRAAELGEERSTRPPRFPGYGSNVVKAWRVLAGDREPTGPKVSRFARNLRGDETPVTVDRWAARAAGLPDGGGRAWYRRIETAYRELARHVGLPPSRVQAILWVAVRSGVVRWGPPVDAGIAFRLLDGAGEPLHVTGSRRIEDRGRP